MSGGLHEYLVEAEALAKEWIDFSQEANGWDSREYGDYVSCYFADSRNHRSVTFGGHFAQIQIAFHATTRFGDITLNAAKNMSKILAKSRQILEDERAKFARRGREEAEALRQQRIKSLKAALAEMGVEDCTVCGEDHEGDVPRACETGDGQ